MPTAEPDYTPAPARVTIADRFHTAAGILAAVVVLTGLSVIAGWWFSIPTLITVFPAAVAMKPITAVALTCSGVALWIYQRPGRARWRDPLLNSFAGAAGLIGFIAILELLTGLSVGLDGILIREEVAKLVNLEVRVAASAAAALVLINGAMLLANRTDRVTVPHVLVGIAVVLTALNIIGYIFDARQISGLPLYTQMAVHTSWALLLLCAGFFLAHPTSTLMNIVSDEGPAGFVVRRLLPAVFVLPVLLAWIWRQGEVAGYYDSAFSLTLFVSSAMAALGAVVWISGHLVRGVEGRRFSAEEQRLFSEERLRRAVTDAPVPMMIHDDADHVLHLSQGWTDHSGYALKDVPTISRWIEVAQRATRDEAEAYMRRLAEATGTIHSDETAITAKNGDQRYWEFTTTPLGTAGDERRIFLTTAVDVTERRNAEASLRQMNESLEQRIEARTRELTLANESLQRQSEQLREQAALLDLASDGIVVRDLRGTIVYWSAGATAMLGYSREQALGQPSYRLLQTVFPQPVNEIEQLVLTSGHWSGEVTMTRRDGTSIAVETSWTLTRSDRGAAQGFLEVHRDITARKLAAESLRESELKFRAVAETANEGIVSADEQGVIRYWNPGAERMFGRTEHEALGQSLTILMPERFRSAHQNGMSRYLETRDARMVGRTVETTGERADGTEFPLEISLSSWQTSKGTFFSAILRDITARRRSEEALKQQAEELARSNHELEQFAYVASHDLQEPLRMVSNYTQLLGRRYRDRLDGDAQEFIDFAVDGAKRMQALIHDLLQYARVGTRGKEFKPTPANRVVEDALANLAGAIDESGAEIRVEALPTVSCDSTQLTQVFQNLIGNALKFRRQDSKPIVQISARLDPTGWRFIVADNGIGIEPKYFERIFQMFQRLHGREQYEGTGIGLALCKKIVERHGGQITVASELGHGTTFSFVLPDASARAARAS
jgi:PAS domain S-box-containing protein